MKGPEALCCWFEGASRQVRAGVCRARNDRRGGEQSGRTEDFIGRARHARAASMPAWQAAEGRRGARVIAPVVWRARRPLNVRGLVVHRRITPLRGNTTPGVVALASRALAVGIAEQAASRSKAAGRVWISRQDVSGREGGAGHPLASISTYVVEFWCQLEFRRTVRRRSRIAGMGGAVRCRENPAYLRGGGPAQLCGVWAKRARQRKCWACESGVTSRPPRPVRSSRGRSRP